MSKKTRKKSPKTSSGVRSGAELVTSAKMKVGKPRRAAAASIKATSGASHKAPSERLKSAAEARKRTDTSAAPRTTLTEGTRAPVFRLLRDGGGTVTLADFAGKKLVLFFYPRANTPGCTKEAIDFTRLASAFAQSRTIVMGVSADPPKVQESFRDKHQLSIPLISDETHTTLQAYGAWGQKSMYGKTFHGIIRTTVLIDTDGLVARIWRNVRVDGHADEVLAAAKAL